MNILRKYCRNGLLAVLLITGLCHPVAAQELGAMENNSISHAHQAEMWMGLGQTEAAIAEYQLAIKLKPATSMSASLYNNLGLAYLTIGMFDRAIASLQQAIALNPNFSLYYENLARIYQKSDALDEAVSRLQLMTHTNPANASAWFLLGHLYKVADQPAESRKAFEHYIVIVPHSELTDAAKLNVSDPQSSQAK